MILTARLGAIINIRVSVLSITQLLLKPKLFGLGNCKSFVAYQQYIAFVGHTMGKGSFFTPLFHAWSLGVKYSGPFYSD